MKKDDPVTMRVFPMWDEAVKFTQHSCSCLLFTADPEGSRGKDCPSNFTQENHLSWKELYGRRRVWKGGLGVFCHLLSHHAVNQETLNCLRDMSVWEMQQQGLELVWWGLWVFLDFFFTYGPFLNCYWISYNIASDLCLFLAILSFLTKDRTYPLYWGQSVAWASGKSTKLVWFGIKKPYIL